MADKILNRETLGGYIARMNKIESSDQRKWGEMSAAKMLLHLTATGEMSLGEVEVEDMSNPILGPIMYLVFFRWFTNWPGGKIKAPEQLGFLFKESNEDVAAERTQAIAKMQQFVDALEADPDRKVLSPLLGMISLRKWSYVHGAHLDHHLRQFGV